MNATFGVIKLCSFGDRNIRVLSVKRLAFWQSYEFGVDTSYASKMDQLLSQDRENKSLLKNGIPALQ